MWHHKTTTHLLTEWLSKNGGEVTTNGRNLTTTSVKEATIAQTVLLNLQNVGQRVIGDIRTSWHWILAGMGNKQKLSRNEKY